MNMQALMAQAQKMQKDIMKKKEELGKKEFVGKSGLVEITMNGNKEVLEIKIDKTATLDKEDLEMLEDMIKLAFKNAITEIDKESEKAMGAYGSLNGLI